MRVALLTAATDPVTGRVDMDLISTGMVCALRRTMLHPTQEPHLTVGGLGWGGGQSTSSRARIADVARAVKSLLAELASGSIRFAQLLADVNRKLDQVRPARTPRDVVRLAETGPLT
jgi:hypothetical protein